VRLIDAESYDGHDWSAIRIFSAGKSRAWHCALVSNDASVSAELHSQVLHGKSELMM